MSEVLERDGSVGPSIRLRVNDELHEVSVPGMRRLLDVLRGRTAPLFIPLNFPEAPDVTDPEAALNASLGELRHWYLAPTNAGQLASAGAFSSRTQPWLSALVERRKVERVGVSWR